MKYFYHYSIDIFSKSLLSGWVRHRFSPKKTITLQFKTENSVLGECSANMLREDVKDQNLHPSGLCGFSFKLPSNYANSANKGTLSIIVKESGTLLTTLTSQMEGKVVRPQGNFWKQLVPPFLSRQKRETIFFMHIPKTAGTSFNSFARKLYHQEDILTHIEAYDASAFPQIAQDYRFISGHLRMDSILQFFAKPDIQLYTIVREPYAQLHSHINWLRGIGADKNSDFYRSHHNLFKELADEFGDSTNFSHQELQRIVDELSGVIQKLLDNNQSRHFLDSDPETVDEHYWEEIEKNYALFTGVGITNKYTDFKEEFCSLNSFPKPPAETPLNAAKYPPLYDYSDPATQEIVFPLVSVDLRLYELAKRAGPSTTS